MSYVLACASRRLLFQENGLGFSDRVEWEHDPEIPGPAEIESMCTKPLYWQG